MEIKNKWGLDVVEDITPQRKHKMDGVPPVTFAWYYRDALTDVLYVALHGTGVTVVVDTDGKPMTYTKYKELYNKKYQPEKI